MEIRWKDEYSIGVSEIDQQHRYFITLLNDLYGAVISNKGQQKLEHLFQVLSDYAEEHFTTEEKYFDKFNYEGAKEHKFMHQKMRDEIKRIKNQETGKEIDFYGNVVYFLNDWLENHLEKMDRKYAECFMEHGVN
ncbi:MAG: bacteriohemerythrin [Parcubacteria group bacterium]|jgi:hemerythrin